MEDPPKVPGSFTKEPEGPTDFDEAMTGMTPACQVGETQQDTQADSAGSSVDGASTSTSATSFQAEEPPPYSEQDKNITKATKAS